MSAGECIPQPCQPKRCDMIINSLDELNGALCNLQERYYVVSERFAPAPVNACTSDSNEPNQGVLDHIESLIKSCSMHVVKLRNTLVEMEGL